MEVVGLHKDGNDDILAQVSKRKGEIRVQFGGDSGPYVTGLSTDQVILRNLFLPLKSIKAAKEALLFQLESCLPSNPDHFVVLPHYEKTKRGIDLSIVAVLKERLEKYIEEQPVDPEVVSCVPIALARFVQYQFPEKKDAVVCHLGKESVDIVVIKDQKVVTAVPLYVGFTNCDELEAELDRALYYIQQKVGAIPDVVLTGLFPQIKDADLFVRKHCDTRVIVVEEKLAYHAIAIGLGIDALSDDGLQFRQQEYVHKEYSRRFWSTTLQSASLILLLTFIGFGITQHFVQKREADLIQRVEQFIALHEKEMSNLRGFVQYEGKTKVRNLLSVLDRLHKSFIRIQKNYRFYEHPFQVSEILTWIGMAPTLASGEVTVDSFEYELEKYPKLGSPYSPYLIKVSLRLNGDPEKIEAFQAFLKEEKEFISHEKKIAWNENENGYTTSFYLKNRP